MRLYWMHLWRSPYYRRGTADERRLIEIRFTLARTVERTRTRAGLTQRQLAQRLGVAQATISRAERASNSVSLDVAVRALIHLGCTDEEVAAAINAGENAGIRALRRSASARLAPAPRTPDQPAPSGEHRFLRKGERDLPRLR